MIRRMCLLIGAFVGPRSPLAQPLVQETLRRVQRISQRFAALQARFAAGTLRPPRARSDAPRARREPAERPPSLLGSRHGWLLDGVQPLVLLTPMLRDILADADTPPLVAASPQAGQILRTLCRGLGIDEMPEFLHVPSRPPRAPAPPTTAAVPPRVRRPRRPAQPLTPRPAPLERLRGPAR